MAPVTTGIEYTTAVCDLDTALLPVIAPGIAVSAVTVSEVALLQVPQAFFAFTVMVPVPTKEAPNDTVMVLVLAPAVMVAPAGTVHT